MAEQEKAFVAQGVPQAAAQGVPSGAAEFSERSLNAGAEEVNVSIVQGRMPLLLRVAEHFGIDRSVAKDVCKMLVLRVLNGGSVAAWCREMEINEPAGEPQADLRDLAEVARRRREGWTDGG